MFSKPSKPRPASQAHTAFAEQLEDRQLYSVTLSADAPVSEPVTQPAQTAEFSMLQTAFSRAIKSIGEGVTQVARQ